MPSLKERVEDIKESLADSYGLDVADWEQALQEGLIGSQVLVACSDGEESVIAMMVCKESRVARRALALMKANPGVQVGVRRLDSFEDALARVSEWEPGEEC
jgi:hypothetical protein